jgi:poly(A) polymerase
MNFKETLKANKVFELVSDCAEELNLETYVIGGFVRDLILERPSKDIDIVCVGSGITLANHIASKIGKGVEVTVFKNFGTAMLKYNDWEIELVGARKESYNRDSRKPIVEEGTLVDDQNRRDFTINAFAISLNKNNYGDLIDPFDGLSDLRKKIIRTPLDPEITFSDDPLRIMRGIRFAAQLNFDIAPETFEAIKRHIERLSIVSMERVTEELNKIILAPNPSYGFKLLFHAGILDRIFPELTALQGVETIENKSHKDNFYHTLQVLDNVAKESNDLWLRWAALLHDIAKPATKRFDKKVGWTFHGHEDRGSRMVPGIFRRMKLPLNEKMNSVVNLVKLHLRPIALVKENITDAAIRRLVVDAGNDIEALMLLCKADVTSKNNVKVKLYLENFKKVERKIKEVEERDNLRNFQPVVTGEDIMSVFNMQPSRMVGDIKTDLREAILDGLVKNEYKEAFNYLLKIAEKKYNLKANPEEVAKRNLN